LRKALEWFDSEGSIPDGASRQAEIEAILALMRELAKRVMVDAVCELGCAPLNQALSSFASGLEGYWSYYQRAEQLSCLSRAI
jgi:hypothetical protein